MSCHCAQRHVATRPRHLRVRPRARAPTALPPLHCVDPAPTHTPPHQRAARHQWLNHKYTHYLEFHLSTSGVIHVTKHINLLITHSGMWPSTHGITERAQLHGTLQCCYYHTVLSLSPCTLPSRAHDQIPAYRFVCVLPPRANSHSLTYSLPAPWLSRVSNDLSTI